MKLKNNFLLVGIFFLTFFSCSTKKNTFISRNFHAITSKYNTLFNGNVALQKGLKNLQEKYKDDFWELLPIEPLKFEEEKITTSFSGPGAGFGNKNDTQKNLTPFQKAEEKAVKAIQLHSMNINGHEKNRQIDDAYLLLGKARYYDQRFVPAIEAFNYVIKNYKDADLIDKTKIWRAKSNIRLGNEKFAIESLKLLLEIRDVQEKKLAKPIKEQVLTTLAMAYLQTDSIEKAKKQLLEASKILANKNQSARNLFILGQLYSREGKKDSANWVFNKLIQFKKAPHKFKIHANIEIAKNITKDSSSTALISHFKDLIKNIDNRPYYDELYYQLGNLNEKRDSISKAITFYNKSIKAKHGSKKQQSYTYEKLGNLYFNQKKYITASNYYDSVLQVATNKKNLRIRRVKRKHKNLASLLKYETMLAKNDSILRIASMSKEAQKKYFTQYVTKLKKEDEERAQQQLNQAAFGAAFNNNSLQSTGGKKSAWYFYNNQLVNLGKTEFQKIWGNIPLKDNWRWSEKSIKKELTNDSIQTKKRFKKYDIASYISLIPTDKKQLDSLKLYRNKALYELGLIYKEQFNNPTIAVKRLERLLQLQPKKEWLLPIHFHLYQIYNKLGNLKKAAIHKKIVISEYPESAFAQILLNPKKAIKTSEEKPVAEIEKKYKKIYYLYADKKYREVVKEIEKIIPTLGKSKLIPKFELLKSYAIGKYSNKESYKKALNFVAVRYPETTEGKNAIEIIKRLN